MTQDQNHTQTQAQADTQVDKDSANADLNGATSLQEQFEAQLKEKENKYLYLYADFENYKKRSIKERQESVKFGWENVARDLLQVVDNLERALSFTPEGTDKNLVMGLQMVLTQFKNSLTSNGVAEVPCLGQAFDPNLHEGVGQEASDESAGTIVKEHLKGYTLHGRLLRPARVTISSGR